MSPDIWSLYSLMLKSRLFEEAVTQLWKDGLISGEMHLGTGEEAIVAGIVSQLRDGDSMALDHRGTPPMLMRGVDPALILRELLGYADGLCGGMGGHMHLYSREHLAASSGIVGAAGPTAAGFALSAQHLRPGAIAVAFFGEGAMNQGMLMESLNLASVWNLPVLFVCKYDGWSITTQSERTTGGTLDERSRGLGVPAVPMLAWKPTARLFRRLARRFVHQDAVSLPGDPTQWHTYVIRWEAGRAVFRVDSEIVLDTPVAPRPPLGLVLWVDNQYAALPPEGGLKYGALSSEEPAWIELRDLHVDQ